MVASASVANGVVYLGSRNGSLYAIGEYQSTDLLVPPVTSTPISTPTQTPSPSPSNAPVNNYSPATVAPTSNPTTTPEETPLPTQFTHPTEKSTPQSQQQDFTPLLIACGIGGCIVLVIGGLGLIKYNRKKASNLDL